jgi:hypothetical protein
MKPKKLLLDPKVIFFYFNDFKKFHHKKIRKEGMMMKLDETKKNTNYSKVIVI